MNKKYYSQKQLLFLGLFTIMIVGNTTPAAAISLDLTSGGTDSINGGIFTTEVFHPAGTGYIDPFVRIDSNNKNGTEEGTNTDVRPVVMDEKQDHQWTHSLQITSEFIFNEDGQDYLKFFLDINEPSAKRKSNLNLTAMQLFIDDADNKYPYPGNFDGTDKRWDMDIGLDGDSEVLLDYNLLSGGSGWGDLSVMVPILSSDLNQYLYLYSAFAENDNNFEEWAIAANPAPVPEPATLLLFGTGLAGLIGTRMRKKKQ